MDLSIYDIIKNISITNKSRFLSDKLGKVTFEVNKHANKSMIKRAVEKIWDVKVKNVGVINLKGKKKSFARKSYRSPSVKKAIVTLKPGYKIDLPGQFESMGVSSGSETKGEGK